MENIELYDLKSKELIMDENVIANIMHYCVDEFKDIEINEIKKYLDINEESNKIITLSNEDIRIDDALIKYDILFTSRIPNSNDKIGLFINIEAQNDNSPGYSLLKRSIYYASRLISRQKGEVFNNSNFDDLKKIYSIWICPLPKNDMKDTINLYSLNEECIKGNYHSNEDYKLINILFLNIGDNYSYDKSKKDILKMLSLLFNLSALKVSENNTILEKDYGILKKEEEVSNMCTLGEGIYLKGKTEGKLEGLTQGKEEGQISLILNMIRNKVITKEDAFKLVDDNIKEALNKELLKQ